MKLVLLSFFITIFNIQTSTAQTQTFDQNLLLDEEDIIVRAKTEEDNKTTNKKDLSKDISDAMNQAKNLLQQKPIDLPKIEIPELKTKQQTKQEKILNVEKLKEAPFGMFWGSNQASTAHQGIVLKPTFLKDYKNVFLASSLPKPIDFFERIYAIFGEEDELYRILTYSKLIEDDSSAQKTLDEYNKYSKFLEKKYGNKQTFFTPAIIEKVILNSRKQEEIIKEEAPIGNPKFLDQLASGQAVLYSTYNNQDIAAALSISVDGEKKSYIVIDYKNIKILQKQEAATLDAL